MLLILICERPDERQQVRITIGRTIREPHFIIVPLEHILKLETIKGQILPCEALILEPRIPEGLPIKLDIVAPLHPIDPPGLLQILRAYKGPHAPMIECLLLPKIANIDLDLLLLVVLDGEIKPL